MGAAALGQAPQAVVASPPRSQPRIPSTRLLLATVLPVTVSPHSGSRYAWNQPQRFGTHVVGPVDDATAVLVLHARTTRGSLRQGGTQRTDSRDRRVRFFDGPYTSYRNTLSRVHCYLCLLGGGGLYAGLYVVAVLMTSVHTVLNAATANTS